MSAENMDLFEIRTTLARATPNFAVSRGIQIPHSLDPYSDIEDPMLCCRKAARALDGGSQPVIPFCGRPDHDRRQDLKKTACCEPQIRWPLAFHIIVVQE